MDGLPRHLCGQDAARADRPVARRARRALELSPRDGPDRRRPDRLSVQRPAGAARSWHGAVDLTPQPRGACRRRRDHPQGQPQRKAIRPQGPRRGDQPGFRLRSVAAGGAGRANSRLWAEEVRAEQSERCKLERERDHASAPRHRQDDRDGRRGGRAGAAGRAGAGRLGRAPCALSRHRRSGSRALPTLAELEPIADELSLLADGNPQPVGNSRKNIKFKRQ